MDKDNIPMVSRSVYVGEEVWDKAFLKSERPDIQRSISQIVNRLLEMWVNDDVVPYPERMADGTVERKS